MCGMGSDPGMTELRRGVLGPCVLALLDERPRFGLELVRDLAAAGGLLTSEGTVYPLLNRLRDARLVTSEWHDPAGERARRYYSITSEGRKQLKAFRADWADFANTVGSVLFPTSAQALSAVEKRADNSKKPGDSGPSTRDSLGGRSQR
jgi:PadR family transcriptional regulator, regulatory protein PadR